MKNSFSTALILATLACTGLSPLSAQSDSSTGSTPGAGLLGVNRFGFSYDWYHYHNSPVNATGYSFDGTWAVRDNLDFSLDYSWLKTGTYYGIRARMQSVVASLRLYTATDWGRPYLEAGAGQAWADASGLESGNSSAYRLGTGFQFKVTPGFTLTPFLYYQDFGAVGDSGSFNYGLKGNCWVGRHWALAASLQRNDNSDLTYSLGVNFRF